MTEMCSKGLTGDVVGGPRFSGTQRTSPRLTMTATSTAAMAVDQLAQQITEKFLGVREHYLPSHNGGGTEAPKCKDVHQVRKEMRSGKNRAWRSILAVAFADVDDARIPSELVAAVLDDAAELVRARARAQQREPVGAPAIRPLMKRLHLEAADVNSAALDVVADESPMSMDVLERQTVELEQATTRLRGALRSRRAKAMVASARLGMAVAR